MSHQDIVARPTVIKGGNRIWTEAAILPTADVVPG